MSCIEHAISRFESLPRAVPSAQIKKGTCVKFCAKVIPSGNATGVEVPADVLRILGSEARPAVVITINGHSWRSRIALMRGQRIIGISAANRAASGVIEGEIIEVELQLDEEPRVVIEPPDLKAALDHDPHARTNFDRLPFGLRRKHVANIESARAADVRQRRIAKLVQALGPQQESVRPLAGKSTDRD